MLAKEKDKKHNIGIEFLLVGHLHTWACMATAVVVVRGLADPAGPFGAGRSRGIRGEDRKFRTHPGVPGGPGGKKTVTAAGGRLHGSDKTRTL